MAGIFARDYVDFAQHSHGAVRQVFKIADGSRDYIERSGHAAILAPSSRYAKGTSSEVGTDYSLCRRSRYLGH